jgi:hypothetical protein
MTKNKYLCPAFRTIAVMKSYMICCVGNDNNLIIRKNGFN